MMRLVVVGLVTVCGFGCISKPTPWSSDGGVEVLSDTPGRNMDGKGEMGLAETRLADKVGDSHGDVEVQDVADAKGDNTCVPNCDEIDCGGDGCGGQCGECNDGLTCTEDTCLGGECVHDVQAVFCVLDDLCVPSGTERPGNFCQWCQPNESQSVWSTKTDSLSCDLNAICLGGECICIDQPCGALCCPEGDACHEEICCTPTCTDKECGDDGCGGSCGDCDGLCNEDHFVCVPEGWVLVDAGDFQMGLDDDEFCGGPEAWSSHKVVITRAFLVEETEVTQTEWTDTMQTSPFYFADCGGNCPADTISWHGAVAYCNKLSELHDLPQCYQVEGDQVSWPEGLDCKGYRLPTEAEWEYFARAGTTTPLFNGELTECNCGQDAKLSKIGWYCGNSAVDYGQCNDASDIGGSACAGVHPVALKQPNQWGLFDTAGGVYEWSWDWYLEDYYAMSPIVDPLGPEDGEFRIIRGGCFAHQAGGTRPGHRSAFGPLNGAATVGFRPVRTLPHCVPQCSDKVCGPDGCGGSCGDCVGPQDECIGGQCICQPNCELKECGDDGCGGKCGSCGSGTCDEDSSACIPQGWSLIPAGSFDMGHPDDVACGPGTATPVHGVEILRPFLMKETEVTQKEWTTVMDTSPFGFAECGSDCPAEMLTWFDAIAYCNKLSEAKGMEMCYEIVGEGVAWPKGLDCLGYRLPTEAEWEYAARAGTTSTLYVGDLTSCSCEFDSVLDQIGWYCGNSEVTYGGYCYDASEKGGSDCIGVHPVAQKQPNAWGLYDTSGNVYEWCWDWYSETYYANSPGVNPLGPPSGEVRVLKGGPALHGASMSRPGTRNGYDPGVPTAGDGFRPVRTLPVTK